MPLVNFPKCPSIFGLGLRYSSYYSKERQGTARGVPFLGHGVGLEVDELPVLARGVGVVLVLEEGMVIAVESKI